MKRSLCLVAAALAVSTSIAWAGSNATPPHSGKKALKILHTNVMKIARDYSHHHYRAVCVDMTKAERAHVGGMTECTAKVALIDLLAPIKKFTITAAKLGKDRTTASVSLYINGIKARRVHAVARWEGGRYRLDSESGWKPNLG